MALRVVILVGVVSRLAQDDSVTRAVLMHNVDATIDNRLRVLGQQRSIVPGLSCLTLVDTGCLMSLDFQSLPLTLPLGGQCSDRRAAEHGLRADHSVLGCTVTWHFVNRDNPEAFRLLLDRIGWLCML